MNIGPKYEVSWLKLLPRGGKSLENCRVNTVCTMRLQTLNHICSATLRKYYLGEINL